MTKEEFAELLRPLAVKLKDIELSDTESATAATESAAPFQSDMIAQIREATEAAMDSDWLLPKEAGGIRFGRVAKDLEGFSVDAVFMSGPGPKHNHPNGEIDLCFTTSGDAQFDGHKEGWVVYGPDSTHIPTVTSGEMVILYFLPGGAIKFL
ncbi:MAG: hypothetical protein ACI97A_003189 [Planctomycetota bacterium]|jgi:hypothetical protein